MGRRGEVTRAGGIRGGDRAAKITAVTAAGRPRARGACTRNEGKDGVTAVGFGCRFRVSGKVRVSAKWFSRTKVLARDFRAKFSGCHKPTPLKMNLVLEIRLASK
jgi:hypothetical protein